jgi:putative tryptophan/tyrosine transport system substrate-binding protein
VKRRQFITLLGGAAAWPVAARAQRPTMRLIGLLGTGTPSTQGQWNTAFMERLRDLGWIEGRNIAIAVRWAQGRDERYAELAAEFVRLKVDVIVAAGNTPVAAAKQATATIPIVSPILGDPVSTGLIAGLARPGGNITGLILNPPGVRGKRIELLREVVPTLHRVAILATAGNISASSTVEEAKASARALGLEVIELRIREATDIAPALATLNSSTDAVYVEGEPFSTANQIRINTLAVGAKLPTMFVQREFIAAGGLMSYGPNVTDLYRRAAELVDKILRGSKSADIPVEQPTKFDLVVNLTTAKTLGLNIPEAFLLRADEVID